MNCDDPTTSAGPEKFPFVKRAPIVSRLIPHSIDGIRLGAAPVEETHLETEFITLLPANARPKRLREFVAGRKAANAALERLGLKSPATISRGPGGQPIWPDTVCGSISHSATQAVAAIGSLRDYRAIGIDIEARDSVGREIWDLIFTPAEIGRLHAARDDAPWPLATATFAAKEAFYKLQFVLSETYLDFLDAEIFIDAGGIARIEVRADSHPATAIAALTRFLIRADDKHVLALCWLPCARDGATSRSQTP